MVEIRISDVFISERKASKRTKVRFWLILTGLLSLVLVLVTIYGQFTGTYLITISREAQRKGIALSETADFKVAYNDLHFEPLNEIGDTLEEFLNIEGAENNDGQYYEEDADYLAFTFYIKNVGIETVNIEYRVRIIDDYKKLGDGTMMKIREYSMDKEEPELVSDTNYSKSFTESNLIAEKTIVSFEPNEIIKFTFFVWLDGGLTDPSMLGGAIKMDWTFGIANAEVDI